MPRDQETLDLLWIQLFTPRFKNTIDEGMRQRSMIKRGEGRNQFGDLGFEWARETKLSLIKLILEILKFIERWK